VVEERRLSIIFKPRRINKMGQYRDITSEKSRKPRFSSRKSKPIMMRIIPQVYLPESAGCSIFLSFYFSTQIFDNLDAFFNPV